MKHRVERIATSLVSVIASWECTECIAVGEHAEKDTLDPHFALVLDVYTSGRIPEPAARQAAFGDPGAFESALVQTKDRFFLEGLPIRVEYKRCTEVDRLLGHSLEFLKILKNSGTYPLYRLQTARILFDRSGWILGARSGLAGLGDDFWNVMHRTFLRKMEHSYADLGEAVMCGDDFYYILATAGFLRFAAASIFMINRRFEPSHREIDEQLHNLPRLPDDFLGAWETFLSPEAPSARQRKFKLAELIARKLVAFR